ncbi:alpha-1,4-N-acetylgalactosamine transferase [Flavobacterium piscis]|uniref:Alpha-1,4-N-acetylgalactosamine transferase n=1 Tax=Flavobacterium piscis TaxID=1114874 RepID=A0ABX2XEL4_9FLAO|nr:glycosyltransferase [Flavobacterium piscis]OCB70607.1 alpha-1,4-N-acetylgalactosamine transferase [Flavobacterium piscis]OXG03733.1 alpha-1,4-N-acetylgalactosamine transferase [Flavobacterium piscis]
MRIVQIIDSLNSGGAERMAVNYANALAKRIKFSGLIVTRSEGGLKKKIDSEVSYLFLKKKKSIDFRAIFLLRKYIAQNKVEIIHAHSSSFFIAVLVKLTLPRIRIIWHDHYGTRAKETIKENRVLLYLSVFFSAIFVVNHQLEDWNKKNMKCSRVIFIPNFANFQNNDEQVTNLRGKAGKRIVFLANLKKPKNHILILKAFQSLKLNESGWSLHLIGKDYFDSYSSTLKKFIESNSLKNHIYLYGEKSDIGYILSQASIGVLASTEEGFPVTLLEYALANLAVASSNVGYCSVVIQHNINGLLFDPFSVSEAKKHLLKLTEDNLFRKEIANNFKQSVLENYSEEIVIEKLILAYKNK